MNKTKKALEAMIEELNEYSEVTTQTLYGLLNSGIQACEEEEKESVVDTAFIAIDELKERIEKLGQSLDDNHGWNSTGYKRLYDKIKNCNIRFERFENKLKKLEQQQSNLFYENRELQKDKETLMSHVDSLKEQQQGGDDMDREKSLCDVQEFLSIHGGDVINSHNYEDIKKWFEQSIRKDERRKNIEAAVDKIKKLERFYPPGSLPYDFVSHLIKEIRFIAEEG